MRGGAPDTPDPLSKAGSPANRQETADVYKNSPWSAPRGDVSRAPHWTETPGQTQDPLDRLYLTLGLGTTGGGGIRGLE